MIDIEALEAKLGLRLPPEYGDWSRRGYTVPVSTSYLWVHEAEWIDPNDIPGYELTFDEPIQGLVPFAFTGRGDLWCWNTKSPTAEAQYDVLFCPQQEPNAALFAPNFTGWFFRVLLEYATSIDETSMAIREAREHLRTWAFHLDALGSSSWAAEIVQISEREPSRSRPKQMRIDVFGFIPLGELEERVRQEFGERYVKSEIRWHLLDEA